MVAAQKIIKAVCEQCPKSEDVWLEAARLYVSSSVAYFPSIHSMKKISTEQ